MIVKVSAITLGIGAEITGIDISQPMNKRTIAKVRELFLRACAGILETRRFPGETTNSSLVISAKCMCTPLTEVS